MVDMIVFSIIICRRQSLTVPSGQLNSAAGNSINIATEDSIVFAPINNDSPIAEIPENTTGDFITSTPNNLDCCCSRAFKGNRFNINIRSVFQNKQRFFHDRNSNFSFINMFRRPKIEFPCFSIYVIFAGRIQLFENI